MALTSSIIYPMSLLLCLVMAAGALATPLEPQQEREDQSMPTMRDVLSSDTEAIPSHDFTLSNVSSTIEEILASIGVLQDTDTRSKRRPCACSTTVGAYGGRQGTAFVDVTTNACDVDITDIWIRHGGIIDAMRVRYNFPDGNSITTSQRGGGGGGLTHITVPQAGKIIGIFGGLTEYKDYGTAITQLRILILDSEDNLQIYGPYGHEMWDYSSTFAVFGNIKSLFGYYGKYFYGLGVYYEPWGVCGSPCERPAAGSG